MRGKEAPIPTAPADDEAGGEPRARRPRAAPAEPHLELFGHEPRPHASPEDDGPRLGAFPEPSPGVADDVAAEADEPIVIRAVPADEATIEAPDAAPPRDPAEVTQEEPPLRASTDEGTVDAFEPVRPDPASAPRSPRNRRARADNGERTSETFATAPAEAERTIESPATDHPVDRDQWVGTEDEAPRRAPELDATLLEPRTVARRESSAKAHADAPEPPRAAPPPPPHADPVHVHPPRPAPFVFDPLRPYRGVVRRFFVVYRHVLGLLAGGSAAYVRGLPRERRHGLHSWFPRLTASIVWPFLDREIRRLPFPQQLRRRLEILGPTYIKLGQIMAIREDLLPRSITRELQNLFDRLPAIPFTQVREIIERSLERPLEESFRSVSEQPLGSASIAQAHLAETLDGERVVVKVIKPGVAEMIESDLTLLGMVGGFLQWLIPRYQPRQIVAEFSAYTRKEVDYTFEADNAETFAANFRDIPDVAFPRIHRHLSSREVLTMEFMDGFKPGSAPTELLTDEE
ncbi:MAG TPA: AarF/UbiB family protein, partial [Longimicrobium sp.]|nr:AarF/UbiB family protein [Longimicrobium sp.]